MSISTFNFQFYNYKLPAPKMATSFTELEMDIDEDMANQAITSTPLPQPTATRTATPTPRFTSELALAIGAPEGNKSRLEALHPQLHTPQKRWSMELREKVLEMSKRNNGSDEQLQQQPQSMLQERFMKQLADNGNENLPKAASSSSVGSKINFFNKLTNTFESAASSNNNNNNNRFISLLRSSRPLGMATTSGTVGLMAPPKPKRLAATSNTDVSQHQFVMPQSSSITSSSSNNNNNSSVPRKSSLRRKPSMDKSRATITRQNSNVSLRPQRHAIMEDLSLVVPVRLRIAEYEQRISMNA